MEIQSCINKKILTIDQGNSSLKAVVWEGNKELKSCRLFEQNVEALLPLIVAHAPEGCVYCSVGHTDARFLESLRLLMEGELLILTPATSLPIDVVYGRRGTLGNDRVAAAAGAEALFPGQGALVVDAGTAVTLDVLDAGATFRGGNIAPGMSLRFESLNKATDRLPLESPEGDVPSFGHDTHSAIRAGVIGGMVSEIADSFARAREEYNVDKVVITGADAPCLAPLLMERGIPVSVEPNLVGRGLLSIYYHVVSSLTHNPS